MSWDDHEYHRWSVDELQSRVRSMIARGVVSNVDDALKMQVLGLKLEDGFRPTKVEHWHPYGMSYHPHAGAEVIALSLSGNRDHIIAIPGADRRYRLKGLAGGELALHDDQGQKVHFKRGGIDIESSKPVTIKAPTIKLEGNIQHTGNMTSSGVHTDANGLHV